MIPARWPRDDPSTARLLYIDPSEGAVQDRSIGDLRALVRGGDLLVVNDAATLPASLTGATEAGEPVEARLLGEREDGAWRAVLFGAGDWRTRTEARPAPPHLRVGDVIRFRGLGATVASVDHDLPRLVALSFDARDGPLWRALYRAGRPVQYAHTADALSLWHVQTAYAARPWASEAPSAGFALTWDLLLDLRRRGADIARVTHAAGLSSTGDEALDRRLPLAERYEIPRDTANKVGIVKENGGRVIAVGTTTARALEGASADNGGTLVPSTGVTDLRLGPQTRRDVVDGIISGMHDPSSSHFSLLEAFAPRSLVERAHVFAEARGYRGHEFGDVLMILPTA